jgi:hypothetical protein
MRTSRNSNFDSSIVRAPGVEIRSAQETTLLEIIDALVPMVAKAPMPPREIRPQHMEQIIERLRAGEPAAMIAKSFNIPDIDQVRAIGKAHGIMVH